jgi:hypothetical protein
VTGSEFAFLAMGLILGVAAGAALIVVLRSRPPATREVRITVAPDAVPRRRAATLANDAFTDSPVVIDPARGGPADGLDARSPLRTPVLGPRPGTVAEPAFRLVGPGGDGNGTGFDLDGTAVAAHGLPVSSGVDPMLSALRASAAASAEAAMRSSGSPGLSRSSGSSGQTDAAARPPDPSGFEAALAVATAPPATAMATASAGARPSISPIDPGGDDEIAPPPVKAKSGSATATPTRSKGKAQPAGQAPAPSGPCGDARRLADERCELATRARAQAVEAEEALRAAQRAYDDHERALAEATAAADPRAVREMKDQAQARFRAARSVARTQEEIEAAAREWLHEINRINGSSGDANALLQRARAAAPEMAVRLERTALEADGARVAAEAAESACVAARQSLADCEERASAGAPSAAPVPTGGDGGAIQPSSDGLASAMRAGASPRIVRLLRGDRSAMQEAVAALAGEDPAERRRWQLALSDLVDALLADAIANSALEYPTDHPFWGPFNRSQSRDITAALSSLGYRFDGLGGWVDDRYPSQRDLSLALGYAGLDPMRMRQWPNESEMVELFRDVQVAAAEHLAGAAGGMTLGELVAMLGRRADSLTEIWNAWGRVRPVLMDES